MLISKLCSTKKIEAAKQRESSGVNITRAGEKTRIIWKRQKPIENELFVWRNRKLSHFFFSLIFDVCLFGILWSSSITITIANEANFVVISLNVLLFYWTKIQWCGAFICLNCPRILDYFHFFFGNEANAVHSWHSFCSFNAKRTTQWNKRELVRCLTNRTILAILLRLLFESFSFFFTQSHHFPFGIFLFTIYFFLVSINNKNISSWKHINDGGGRTNRIDTNPTASAQTL